MKYKFNLLTSGLMAVIMGLSLSACKKLLPEDRDFLDSEAKFIQNVYQPTMGQTTLMSNNFEYGNSSVPLTFKILNIRNSDDEVAYELLKPFPVLVWKERYFGDEKSLEEIEAKREIQKRPLFEIREHSGEFILWAESRSNIIKAQPDSGYTFDVEISNSGGRRYFYGLKLKPFREVLYTPNKQDPVSGSSSTQNLNPFLMRGVKGEKSGKDLKEGDVIIYFNRIGDGNSLTFKFLDTLQSPIDPRKFNLTDWESLIHGFNMKISDTEVKYDVAYPIPLVPLKTKYTTASGSQASLRFAYERLGLGNIREEAEILFNFSIFRKGSWEIVFYFKNEVPKFENE